MRRRVRARLGTAATTGVMSLVLSLGTSLGMVGAAAPAYSAPDNCAQPTACPPGEEPPAGDENPAGDQQQPGDTSSEETKPEKPPPDTEAPAAPLLGQPTVSPDGEVELSVTAETDAKLVLEENQTVVAQATATGQPQVLRWTTTDGTHSYTVTATDKAGNESTSSSVVVDVDATPPAIKRFVARSGNGKDTHSHITITTERDAAFRLRVDEKLVQEGTTADGTIEQTLDLADGRHRIDLELRDEVGNLTSTARSLVVRIPELAVKAALTSDVTDDVQTVRVASAAGITGVVEVPGEPAKRFRLKRGGAEVELALSDGDYKNVSVTVRDDQGRTGSVTLPDITVDTTAPVVTMAADTATADQGRLSVDVEAEDSTAISWQLLDRDDAVVAAGEYIAVGRTQTIQRDVAEGSYELLVTATDSYGRRTAERVSLQIAADPLPTSTLALAAVGLLALVSALAVAAVALWRRRRGTAVARHDRREAKRRGAAARRAATAGKRQVVVPSEADEAWHRRHDVLTRLLDVAQGEVPADVPPVTGLELLPDECVLYATPARLTDRVAGGRGDVRVEVDRGELLVTSQRLAFVGQQQARDWWLALVERVRHVDHRHTTIELWDSESRSGIEYDDPEVTRLYLDLAMSGQNGTREAYLSQLARGLQDHEMRRPSAA